MEEKERRIAESLRVCADAAMHCRGCVEKFSFGCAARLKHRAADSIDALVDGLEAMRRNVEKAEILNHSEGTGEETAKGTDGK